MFRMSPGDFDHPSSIGKVATSRPLQGPEILIQESTLTNIIAGVVICQILPRDRDVVMAAMSGTWMGLVIGSAARKTTVLGIPCSRPSHLILNPRVWGLLSPLRYQPPLPRRPLTHPTRPSPTQMRRLSRLVTRLTWTQEAAAMRIETRTTGEAGQRGALLRMVGGALMPLWLQIRSFRLTMMATTVWSGCQRCSALCRDWLRARIYRISGGLPLDLLGL